MSEGFTRPWRWLPVAVLAIVVLGIQGRPSSAAPRQPSSALAASAAPSCPASVRSLGTIALAAEGRLEIVDLARCRVAVSRAPGAGEVRFSPNGRWLAYSPFQFSTPSGPVRVRALSGGEWRTPLGRGIVDWAWAPTGALLYGLTDRGSLLAASPDGPRRVVATNLGNASTLMLSPAGDRAAVMSTTCAPSPTSELDTVDLRTGARTVLLKAAPAYDTPAGWSPNGHWLLFWAESICSASVAADGLPLYAVPADGGSPVKVLPSTLLYDDFLSWCGSHLIAASGYDRETEIRSKLESVAPPAWRARVVRPARALSWVSPSCAPGGRVLAAAAGPNHEGAFGLEHRSIWLLRAGSGAVVRKLTVPPAADLSDEAPRFSRDGRWILFVRTEVVGNGSRDTLELVRVGGGAAIPIIDFSSGDFSFYDHFDWPYEIDWHQPAG